MKYVSPFGVTVVPGQYEVTRITEEEAFNWFGDKENVKNILVIGGSLDFLRFVREFSGLYLNSPLYHDSIEIPSPATRLGENTDILIIDDFYKNPKFLRMQCIKQFNPSGE